MPPAADEEAMASRLDDAAFDELVRECRAAAARGLRGTWWRGVRFAEDARPAASDMGLPPPERCEEGRFNRRGECVLYLARTLEAVAAECPPRRGRPALFVQRYDVDLPDARVLEPPRDRSRLAWAWAQADERASAREDYGLSHRLADVFRAAGVDVVLYTSDESTGDGLLNAALFGDAARGVERMAVGDPERA